MKLSSVYANIVLWAMVYHTQPGSSEVELITTRFFKSKKKAWKWFDRKHKASDYKHKSAHYVEPEAVEVSHFDRLTLHSERLTLDAEDIHE